MTTIVGGLRARLIHDSLFIMLRTSLSDLGWFDANRRHRPLHLSEIGVERLEVVPQNTAVLVEDGLAETQMELGSNLAENRWTFYVDFYGEDEVIGKHFINDVRDILAGRMSSIGRDDPSCAVYDYRQATPPRLFSVQIEDIGVDRAHDFPKPWQRFWYTCRFFVVDAYDDEAVE